MWRIELKASALRDLESLDPPVRRRVLKRIDTLSRNPRPPGAVRLSGSANEWRVRAGDYRIVYEIHDHLLLVLIIAAGHRRDIYRGR